VKEEMKVARKYATVSVYVEDSAPGNGSFEMFDLVIRGDESANEEGGADDGEIEGEKEG